MAGPGCDGSSVRVDSRAASAVRGAKTLPANAAIRRRAGSLLNRSCCQEVVLVVRSMPIRLLAKASRAQVNPRPGIQSLAGRWHGWHDGPGVACTWLVCRMYLACMSQPPPKHMACSWLEMALGGFPAPCVTWRSSLEPAVPPFGKQPDRHRIRRSQNVLSNADGVLRFPLANTRQVP